MTNAETDPPPSSEPSSEHPSESLDEDLAPVSVDEPLDDQLGEDADELALVPPLLAIWKSNAWTDLALVLPVFLVYHLGVVLLRVRNAADWVTAELIGLAENNLPAYWGLTLLFGAAMVVVLVVLGKRHVFEKKKFALVLIEGVLYAMAMRLAASRVVGALPLAAANAADSIWSGVVMSMGAGLYEEIAFRVVLFAGGAYLIRLFFGGMARFVLVIGWAIVAALIFSGWHHVGPLADDFRVKTFIFRAFCGLFLTVIFRLRGFAPAVWTHAVYDIWALTAR